MTTNIEIQTTINYSENKLYLDVKSNIGACHVSIDRSITNDMKIPETFLTSAILRTLQKDHTLLTDSIRNKQKELGLTDGQVREIIHTAFDVVETTNWS